MRPRVFPAEDHHVRILVSCALSASMRPRVFPAEDTRLLREVSTLTLPASMRPRVFPAEDGLITIERRPNNPLQ